MINRSVFSGHSQAAVFGVGAVELNISNSVMSSNGIGVFNAGGNPVIRLSNNDVSFNGTALSGATQTFGNNRMRGERHARHASEYDWFNAEPHRFAIAEPRSIGTRERWR